MRKRVLVVDDVSTNLKCLHMILRDQYEIKMVKSGREALKCISDYQPHLIILDICMEEMDGFEVLKKIKESQSTAAIPVILATASTDPGCSEKGYQLGASGFIRKPFVPQGVLKYVNEILAQEEK
jgi:CheY-like chemotaxis protein